MHFRPLWLLCKVAAAGLGEGEGLISPKSTSDLSSTNFATYAWSIDADVAAFFLGDEDL